MNALARLRAWFQTHQRQALIGGAVIAGGLALRARSKAASSSDTSGSADVTDANTNTPAVAGLTSGGDSSGVGGEDTSALSEQLSQIGQLLDQRLPPTSSTTPAKPTPPTPLPKPGAQKHKIVRGDTLAKIATEYYGTSTARTLVILHVANPTLLTFSATARLDAYAGHTMTIPKYTAAKPKPKPKPRKPTRPPEHLKPPA